jgi:hypothetical protein
LLAFALAAAAGTPATIAAQEFCPERFHIEVGGHRLSLPFCTTHQIDRPDPAIERIVFSIHGVGTNAETYFRSMVEAAEQVPGALARTLIIAPQLMTRAYAETVPLGPTDLFWETGSGRFWGGLSGSSEAHPRPAAISSFEMMDRLLEHLVEPGRFPNLEMIVLAGHSGGGQFTNRYAAATIFDHAALERRGIRIRYIVSNPSSYVYLSAERVVPGVRTRDEFAVPPAEMVEACPGFDRYGTGLQDLGEEWSYIAAVGVERIRQQYGTREVVYLMGTDDSDPQGAALARGCEAMLQGAHRLERGITYFNYIEHFYNGRHNHRISFVPRVAHDHARMWGSAEGLLNIFDHWPYLDRRPTKSAVHGNGRDASRTSRNR